SLGGKKMACAFGAAPCSAAWMSRARYSLETIASTFFLASASAMRVAAAPTVHSGRTAVFGALEAGPSAIQIPLVCGRTYRSSSNVQAGFQAPNDASIRLV